jgi:uncharacterized Zn-finger protein
MPDFFDDVHEFNEFQMFNGPGGLTGQAEVTCPVCGETWRVPVEAPDGTDRYECPLCDAVFEVNWWLQN